MESDAVDANETFAVTRPSMSVTECPEAISRYFICSISQYLHCTANISKHSAGLKLEHPACSSAAPAPRFVPILHQAFSLSLSLSLSRRPFIPGRIQVDEKPVTMGHRTDGGTEGRETCSSCDGDGENPDDGFGRKKAPELRSTLSSSVYACFKKIPRCVCLRMSLSSGKMKESTAAAVFVLASPPLPDANFSFNQIRLA